MVDNSLCGFRKMKKGLGENQEGNLKEQKTDSVYQRTDTV